jgi:glyoxylase-like metal-dependent hydrolase (beta-lactamase superfamily II)
VVIDSVIENTTRDEKIILELWLKVKYFFDTHIHADHITGNSRLKELLWTWAIWIWVYNTWVTHNDLFLEDKQLLRIWDIEIKIIETPWHTRGCMSYHINDMIFTWDLLLVRGSGRTDFQSGSNKNMFHSVREKIFSLSDATIIYPAHDYNWFTSSSVWEEKLYNPRLKLDNSFNDFKEIMDNLNLPYPMKLDISLPANMKCWHIWL